MNSAYVPLRPPVSDPVAPENPAELLRRTILAGAGVKQGGRSVVQVSDAADVKMHGTDLIVLHMPGMLTVAALTGRDGAGRQVTIPWHAVQSIRGIA